VNPEPPGLVAGPMLRFVAETEATVWVETATPCQVEVLGARADTFTVADHHYALVCIEDLAPGSTQEYQVHLDGRRVWPQPGSPFPPSRIRTLPPPAERLRIAFGSCRICAPHEPPYSLPQTQHEEGRGIDALRGYGSEVAENPPETWPHLLLLLGDQIYADDLSPRMRELIRAEHAEEDRPLDELVTFAEFALAYQEAWTDPVVRWLLSTIPTAMIFDDHEVHNAWRISQAWLDEKRAEGWYTERVGNALSAYWLYQHLGNLSPAELRADGLLAQVREARDAKAVLREFAARADREPGHSRWSFARRLGRSRLVVIDSRAGRVLTPGARRMVEPGEWEWVEAQIEGTEGHLLLASSLPVLVGRGQHHVEAWNEAICDGRWGRWGTRLGERIRQAGLLEHWAAFDRSFRLVAKLLLDVVQGRRGTPPASVLLLSGDVHHAFVARVRFAARSGIRTPIWQLTCSPLRMYLARPYRLAFRFAESRPGALIGRALALTARLPAPPLRWHRVATPSYDNQIATLDLEGPHACFRLATAAGSSRPGPRLRTIFERDLTADRRAARRTEVAALQRMRSAGSEAG
jgi:hypothetical protein